VKEFVDLCMENRKQWNEKNLKTRLALGRTLEEGKLIKDF